MSVIKYRDLKTIRKQFAGKVIVICSGVFDLTHAGHVLFLEECKKYGDILVVVVGDDVSVKEYKGGTRPLLNQYLRLKMVDSFKPVDYCFIGPKSKKPGLIFMEYVFNTLRPDIYVVNDDVPDLSERRATAKKFNIELKVLKRICPPEFKKISTTKIIKKIKEL